jgi:glycine cleavage system transcriptional repressor
MKQQLLVTAAGEDRPGIVARLTEIFVKHGANLEESRMAILGGEFAAIILISIPSENVQALEKELSGLKSETITATTKATKPLDPQRFANHHQYELILNGADHEGIVHNVSTFLRDRSINIESMETTVVPAPVTGSPLFKMKAALIVPPTISAAELNKHLAEIGTAQGVDISISERQPAAAKR